MKRSILTRSLGTYDYPAILRNAMTNAAFWGRRAGAAARIIARGVCFSCVFVLWLLVLWVVALLRWALWHIDENWLYTIEHE